MNACGEVKREKRFMDDVYDSIPAGSLLTKDILKKSIQVVPNKPDLILIINTARDVLDYSPHLLFFDDSLKLYAVHYFTSSRLRSVKNNVIHAYLHEARVQYEPLHRQELPKKYTLKYTRKNFGGYGVKGDKIIDSIRIDKESLIVTLFVRSSEDRYAVLNFKRLPKKTFETQFTTKAVLSFPISDLEFDYQDHTVSVEMSHNIYSNSLLLDKMFVLDDEVYNQFYDDLFEIIHPALSDL